MNNSSCKVLLLLLLASSCSIPQIQAKEMPVEDSSQVGQAVPIEPTVIVSKKLSDPASEKGVPSTTPAAGTPTTLSDLASQEELQEAHQWYQEALEPYFAAAREQAEKIDKLLEDLAYTASYSRKLTRDPNSLRSKIASIRGVLNDLRTTNVVVLDEGIILTFLCIAQEAANMTLKAMQNGLDSLEAFDINNVPFPSYDQEISGQSLEKMIIKNQELIEKIEKKSNSLGLSHLNRFYRAVKHYIIRPAQRNNLLPVALAASYAGATAFTLWYYFGGKSLPSLRSKVGWPAITRESFLENDPENLKLITITPTENKSSSWFNIFSSNNPEASAPQQAVASEATAITKPVGWLGKFEHNIRLFSANYFPLGMGVLGTGAILANSLAPEIGRWIARKADSLDRFLMGGAYRYKQDSLDNNSLVTFNDVIGQEDAKQYLKLVIEYLKNPESWDRTKTAPSTGIFFFGRSRSGKTLLMKAFEGELHLSGVPGFKLWKIDAQLIYEKGFQWVMDEARRVAPVILELEEAELVLSPQRETNPRMLAEVLTAMSSCMIERELDKPVILIATTNNLENIDPALLQEGRFGKHIYFTYPEFNERKLYITRELSKTACDLNQFDIDMIARETEGCSYEKVGCVIKHALQQSKVFGKPLTQKSIEDSLDENIRGITSKSSVQRSEKQKQIIATHLAGQALAAYQLNSQLIVGKLTLKDVQVEIQERPVYWQYYEDTKQNPIEQGKIFFYPAKNAVPFDSYEDKVVQCKVNLAGNVAERILLGECGYGYRPQDKQTALNIATSVVSEGLVLDKLPKQQQNRYFDSAFELVQKCETEVATLLEEKKETLQKLVDELMAKETLSEREIKQIIFGKKADKKGGAEDNKLMRFLAQQEADSAAAAA